MEEILLTIAILVSVVLVIVMKLNLKRNKLSNVMSVLFICLIIWCFGLLLQKASLAFSLNVKPIYFDYITYIGTCILFPTLIVLSFYYNDNNIKFNKKWFLLYIVPIMCLIILWTNDLHSLFYKVYSIKFSETIYGPVFYINTIYSYTLAFIFMVKMINISIKKSGFFTRQTALMIIGSLIPLVVNMLGTARIINISIYITPTLFCITLIFYMIAIIKYKALNITPVALETVTDTMSDAFVVISDDGTIADSNLTFRKTFSKLEEFSKEKNLFELISKNELFDINKLKKIINQTKKNDTMQNVEYNFRYKNDEKFFEVDIHPIKAKKNKNQYIGTLLLFKDITQHKLDIKEIEEKQEIIVKQGQLVSIGELAGGVAHDINTPISAIKTGITMLSQNPDRNESEKEILQRMDNCATKIINIVNSMRNQIRNLGGTTKVNFKISEVINDIKVITYHEVCKNKSELNITIEDDLSIEGDPTKLGQVLTNLVVNAAQAYGDIGGKIDVSLSSGPNKMALIKVRDFAGGLDPTIKPYIFKNILTTKGTFGTGLGLYLAYSVIKGEFNGEISFDSDDMGTTFYISIPIM